MQGHLTVIKAGNDGGFYSAIRNFWDCRALLFALVRRDIAVRFKQAIIGFAWVVFQPLISSLVFAVIFGIFAKFDSGSVPYPFFVLSGMILWQLFARSSSDGAGSLVSNAHLLTKVYFPRVVLPLVPALTATVDYLLAILVMAGLLLITDAPVAWTIVFLPLVGLLAGLMGFGIALLLAPLNALYRDVGIALPFAMQTLLFLTPIAYPPNVIPARYLWLLDFHPLATLMGLMRWAAFGSPCPSSMALLFMFGTIVFLIAVGERVMRRLEGTLVDRI